MHEVHRSPTALRRAGSEQHIVVAVTVYIADVCHGASELIGISSEEADGG